ncbi:MAG: hypothetical protein PVH03_13725 [Chloroflexota bacterium]|jgi:hypothetical protein
MSGTTKSGLLFGVISFLANLGIGILLAICSPLCGIVWGAGAGILSIVWAEPGDTTRTPARSGAIAGGIAGIGAILGLFLGMIFQFTILGGQQTASQVSQQFSEQFGLPTMTGEALPFWQWVGFLLSSCCIGLFNILIMAGAGAAAAHLYSSNRGKTQPAM